MHYPAEGGITSIKRQMGSGIRRRTPLSLYDVSFKVHDNHIVDLHGLIRHSAGFNDDEAALSVNRADVTQLNVTRP